MAVPSPPADHRRRPDTFKVGCLPQGADKILKRISGIQLVQPFCGLAHNLEYNGHRSLFAVIVRNGERNPLAVVVYSQYDKLAGSALRAIYGASTSIRETEGFSVSFLTILYNDSTSKLHLISNRNRGKPPVFTAVSA